MSEQLKACPFCEPALSDPVLVNGGPGNFFVMCNGCNCETDDGTKERAVSLWNDQARDIVKEIDAAEVPHD